MTVSLPDTSAPSSSRASSSPVSAAATPGGGGGGGLSGDFTFGTTILICFSCAFFATQCIVIRRAM
ncbi:MAG: hypothetical protein LC800_08250 [Acidobacteria bacterium]|nr:hypothetical protein [Acidobacteriota bacterium]